MTVLYDNAAPNPDGYRDIDAARVAAAGDKVRLVDVRQPHEYTGELGHAPGSELVPLETVEGEAESWDKEQELVLICRSGARSGRTAMLLASKGFKQVMNMTGGMIAWNAAKLPVER